MLLFWIIIGWLACSVHSYFLHKSYIKKDFGWTQGSRLGIIIVSLLFGPLTFIVGLFMCLIYYLGNLKKPVKW